MSTDQAIKVNLQKLHLGVQHFDARISDTISQVMGLNDDYSREDIDETLKNHSQDIGVCYFHRQKVQFAWMGAKHFEIQKTFPPFYLESEHFFFSGLYCLTLGASREPLMESHEAYQVFQKNLFFGS